MENGERDYALCFSSLLQDFIGIMRRKSRKLLKYSTNEIKILWTMFFLTYINTRNIMLKNIKV